LIGMNLLVEGVPTKNIWLCGHPRAKATERLFDDEADPAGAFSELHRLVGRNGEAARKPRDVKVSSETRGNDCPRHDDRSVHQLQVIKLDPVEHTSRDVTVDIAREVAFGVSGQSGVRPQYEPVEQRVCWRPLVPSKAGVMSTSRN
jgi:hypothetical protein